jgi:D-glycerate 3-kinase
LNITMPARSPLHSTHGYAKSFVARILQDALSSASKAPIYGIVGLQGCGKSTLSGQIATMGKAQGLNVVVLSIDDFYLGKRERQTLGRKIHPLLAKRGPPGTHDVKLACTVLDKLKKGTPVALPSFDKISDTRLPPSRWQVIQHKADLVIFEGWFLFARPEAENVLHAPINSLERDDDAEGIWRRYCNHALQTYAPLWQRIDRSLFLQGPGFEQVKTWRWQQEQTLQAKNPKRHAMKQADVENFILLFERVSRRISEQMPSLADTVVSLDKNRKPLLG